MPGDHPGIAGIKKARWPCGPQELRLLPLDPALPPRCEPALQLLPRVQVVFVVCTSERSRDPGPVRIGPGPVLAIGALSVVFVFLT